LHKQWPAQTSKMGHKLDFVLEGLIILQYTWPTHMARATPSSKSKFHTCKCTFNITKLEIRKWSNDWDEQRVQECIIQK
jgi:hypothetical protein